MEISMMMAQLKSDAKSLSDEINKELETKQLEVNSLRLQLGALEQEIKQLTDYREALHMTADSLGLVSNEQPAPEQKPEPKNIHHSRKPKKIGKYDPNGKKICEYHSINDAAKSLGWGYAPLVKYIKKVSKDSQIKLRGFYLEYIAA